MYSKSKIGHIRKMIAISKKLVRVGQNYLKVVYFFYFFLLFSYPHSKNVVLYQVDISTQYRSNAKRKFHFESTK